MSDDARIDLSWLAEPPFDAGVRICAARDDLIFVMGPSNSDRYVFNEIYEADLYDFDRIRKLLPSDGHVIDIGGHKGFFSCLAARHFRRVHSFEASDVNYAYLSANARVNGLTNLETRYEAVYSSDGEVSFHKSSRTDARNAIEPTAFAGKTEVVVVPAVRLQTVFDRHEVDVCSILKIDCEGAEYEILRNLPAEYFQRIHLFLLELHEELSSGPRVMQVLQLLSERGFEIAITSDKLMRDDLYTCMAVAVNRERVETAARDGLFRELRPIQVFDGQDYDSHERRLFRARALAHERIACEKDVLAPLFPRASVQGLNLSEQIHHLVFNTYAPEVLFFWPESWHEASFRRWQPYIERLGVKAAVMVRKPPKGDVPDGGVPIFFEEAGFPTDMAARCGQLRLTLHPRDGQRNVLFQSVEGLPTVFLGRADDDNAAGPCAHHGAYTRVFVSSEAAAERYRAAGVQIAPELLEPVGAPVSAGLVSRTPSGRVETILYAPASEGTGADDDYSSLPFAAAFLGELRRARPDIRVLFLPDRNTGKRLSEYAAHVAQLDALLQVDAQTKKLSMVDALNACDLLLTDVGGPTAEFLFTGQPAAMLLHPSIEERRRAQQAACGDWIQPVEPTGEALVRWIESLEQRDERADARARARRRRFAGCETFAGLVAKFESAVCRTASLARRPNTDAAARAAALILASVNERLLQGHLLNDGGSSAKGRLWVRSPFGLAEPQFFAGKRLRVTRIEADGDEGGLDANLDVGDVLEVTDCHFVQHSGRYRLQARNTRTGEPLRGTLPKNAVHFRIEA